MNKSSTVKTKEEKAARKKAKRKKGTEEKSSENHGSDINVDETDEESRSGSRGRKPLSSLFRKSADSNQRSRSRSESRDKSKKKSKGKQARQDEVIEATPVAVNPRLDPREHYRRMTVREALKDSRARGRSPGRPTARLEQWILDTGPEGERNNLMSSAPHLLDFAGNDELDNFRLQTDNKSGSTLPRTKRHHKSRGRSADSAEYKRSKIDDRDHMLTQNLPLDKRKYMIDKDKLNHSNQEIQDTVMHAAELHSIPQEPITPTYTPSNYLEQEKSRRESFNQFLQLRDNKPKRYSSSSLSTRDSITEENLISPQQNTDVSNAPSSGSTIKDDKKYLVKLPSYEDAIAEKKRETQINAAETNKDIQVDHSKETNIDAADSDTDEFVDCLSSPTSPIIENTSSAADVGKPDIKKHIFFKNDIEPHKTNSESSKNLPDQKCRDKPNTPRPGVFSFETTTVKPTQPMAKEEDTTQSTRTVDRQESFRRGYVSPRRFSRASKASVKSEDSNVSAASNEHASPSSPVKTDITIENETETSTISKFKPKYHRHFSKKKHEIESNKTETRPSGTIIQRRESNKEETTKQHQQEEKEQRVSSSVEHENQTNVQNTIPDSVMKDSNNVEGSEENVSIQIGSKTYIAAVSAFKALLGRSKRANESNENILEPRPSLETSRLKETSSFEISNEIKAELVTEKKVDTDSKPKLIRPKFTLSADTDDSEKDGIQIKTVGDDEVFESMQDGTKELETDTVLAKSIQIENRKDEVTTEPSSPSNQTELEKLTVTHATTPLIQACESEMHFRRISDRSSDSEEYVRRGSLPVISNRLSKDSHSNLVLDNKTLKAKSDLDISKKKEHEMKDEQTETDFDTRRCSLDVKEKKGKDRHKKKKIKRKSKKKRVEIQKKEAEDPNDPSVKGILKKQPDNKKTNKEGHKKIEKTGSRAKLVREKRVERAPLVMQRSSSLTDIRAEKNDDKHKRPHKTRSVAQMRSRSYDNVAALPHKVDRKRSKSYVDKGKTAHSKPPARLSMSVIVLLRSKIARMRKAKQKAAEENAEQENNDEEQVDGEGEETSIDIINDGDKALIENELNTSIGKLTENDTFDDELENIYGRKIKFDPYCPDDISEEELIKQRQRNTRLTSRRESKVRQRQKKVINCCKKFIAFLFSHIGLCSLMVGYSIAGGFIFQELEAPYEIQKNNEMENLRKTILQNIWDLAFEVNYNKGSREVFKREVDAILKNYSQRIQRETKESGWDGDGGSSLTGDDVTKQAKLWSFPSSLLFAITVMTTIGYGHVAPKTDTGRIVTIAYALLGIPLTLLCLTNIGDVMAHGFRMLYAKVCCGVCCLLFRPSRRKLPDPEKGLPPEEQRMMITEEEKSEEVIHVPTSLCILLMASYIMLGTLLFAKWEGWDPITGTYFCFITLSTIGFGDVVPGTDSEKWDEKEKLVLCAMYLVFGLSLIAMCFNLVQEDVKAKCRWLGMKLGIIDKPVSSV